MLQCNKKLLVNSIRRISDKGTFLIDKMQSFAFYSIRNNIATYLLNIYRETKDSKFTIKHFQQQLADTFGVTQPALVNTITELTKADIITSKDEEIEILDVTKLQQIAKQ